MQGVCIDISTIHVDIYTNCLYCTSLCDNHDPSLLYLAATGVFAAKRRGRPPKHGWAPLVTTAEVSSTSAAVSDVATAAAAAAETEASAGAGDGDGDGDTAKSVDGIGGGAQ